uniref:Uncharacterized protein n=1 Tax=Oncorhynchus kisutch TaxID=8019 RepID=A0A8C7IE01_ONCKI
MGILTCLFSFSYISHFRATIKPNPRDWVGWGTTKDTFVWVEPSLDPIGQDLVRKQVVFQDSAEFYQLCYADSNDQVRGANYCLENHHLVITTQEQYNAQYLKSKDCVLKTINMRLRSVLKEQQQEIDRLKVCFQVVCSNSSFFLKLISDNFVLFCRLIRQTLLLVYSLTSIHEKYEQALIKIQQLKKEQEELKGKVEVQSVEIAQLTPRLKSEQETRRLGDYIQLLQVSPLSREARTQLHQASNNTRRRAEKAERELEEVYERMESTSMTSAQTKQKSSKLEVHLYILNKTLAEMAKVENEELSRENQDLRRDIERLRKEFTDLPTAPVSLEPPSPYGSPADPTPTEEQQLDVLSETPGNLNSPAVGKPHLNIPE